MWGGLVLIGGLSAAHAGIDASGKVAATSPSDALAQCKAIGLSACPEPFDPVLPDPKVMLTWDQKTRVIGFRNTYRQYQGDVFHTLGAKPLPLPLAPRQNAARSLQHGRACV